MDVQVEIAQHRVFVGIAEPHILEADLALQRRRRAMVALHHLRLGIDQGEHPLRRRKPLLHLRPESRQVEHREEETIQALDEQVPRPGGDDRPRHAQPTDIHQHRHGHAAECIEHREDHRQHQPAAHIDPVGLAIGLIELIKDAGFLAEILGHRRCR